VSQGILYVVATPIGNYADLTLRGLRVLQDCDAVVCEERRAGSTLLNHFQVNKPLYEWNEHSRPEDARALFELLAQGKNLALISDHGTPLIQDPGAELLNAAIRENIRIEPIPGASAILAALVASGIPAPHFRFIGRLPQKKEERARTLNALRDLRETMILIDVPYRLDALLKSLSDAFGESRRAAVACNLTMPDELFVRGTLNEILAHFAGHPFKGEFVIVVQGHEKISTKRK
jgi:16S rRNA (cytidine1402-2'-O)-methyltransferase